MPRTRRQAARGRRVLASALLAMVVLAAGALAPAGGQRGNGPSLTPASAAAAPGEPTVWLCRPEVVPNPCDEGLDTTLQEPGGGERRDDPPREADRSVACFYVYPTVSNQPGPNSDRTVEPEQVAIARYQAARFSQVCDVWAPMYRQITVPALLGGASVRDERQDEIAYADVLQAYRDFRSEIGDRGVVLLGHSQGTRMLRALLKEEIDPDAEERGRLVGGVLLGGNLTTARGSRTGGDLRQIPTCSRESEVGCLHAFSAYDEPPPANSRFGRASADSGWARLALPPDGDYRVACTNPVDPAGNARQELETLSRSEPFPGLVGLTVQQTYGGSPPRAATRWVRPADRYTAACEETGGADVLRIVGQPGARDLAPSPDATWGLHIADANLPLGDLVRRVREQVVAFEQAGRTVLRVSESRVRFDRRAGKARTILGCRGPATCSGTVVMRSVGTAPRTLASGAYRLQGGERRKVRLRPTALGRSVLPRRGVRTRIVAGYAARRGGSDSADRVVRTQGSR